MENNLNSHSLHRRFAAILAVALSLVFITGGNRSNAAGNAEKLKITLEVVQAYDMRLPTLGETDARQVLDEAKRMIMAKLGNEIEIEFHDNGVKTLDELFKETSYRTPENTVYQNFLPWKYDIALGKDMPILKEPYFKEAVTGFLRQWDLDSLKDFFPGAKINDYDGVFDNLMDTYHKKVQWLRTLKTKNGEKVLIEWPPAPYQSKTEWEGYGQAQDKYDIIITNTLIVLDTMAGPYPHAICKHAKIGGMKLRSPKRPPMDGQALLVNIFEDYGEVPGISPTNRGISREMKNKIVGGFYLAHEFGHAFFLLPDVYDHGDYCLMNSSTANSEDSLEGYRLLAKNSIPCRKCRPWIAAKKYVIRARLADEKGDFNEAAKLYLIAAKNPPLVINRNFEWYTNNMRAKACEEYQKAGNEQGVAKQCAGN